MIHLELQPETEARLAAEAQARGLAVDRYIEKIVESCPAEQLVGQQKTHSIGEAIDRILALRRVPHISILRCGLQAVNE